MKKFIKIAVCLLAIIIAIYGFVIIKQEKEFISKVEDFISIRVF